VSAASRNPSLRGFALLVALCAVITTAGVLVPEWQSAQRAARARALVVDLAALNAAVAAFRRDHDGQLPGSDGDSVRAELLVRQLTLPTARDGAIHERGSFGSYLRHGLPVNPLDGSSEVRVVAIGPIPGPDGNGGWLFHAPTGQFHSNSR